MPIIYTTSPDPTHPNNQLGQTKKAEVSINTKDYLPIGRAAMEIDSRIPPEPADLILEKSSAGAFFVSVQLHAPALFFAACVGCVLVIVPL